MYKFNEEEVLQSYNNGIQLRPEIEEKLDALWKKGSFCGKCGRILGYRK